MASSSPPPDWRRRWNDLIARRRWLALGGGAIVLMLLPVLDPPRPRLLWNASASSPVGLYGVGDPRDIRAGETVVAWPPAAVRRLAAERHYLPFNVPLVKPVAAVSGDRVCARGRLVSVNGRPVALRLPVDRYGRALPWWRGCRLLAAGELFLLSTGVADAFDGRYFGITDERDLIGRASLLWPRD